MVLAVILMVVVFGPIMAVAMVVVVSVLMVTAVSAVGTIPMSSGDGHVGVDGN